MPGHAERWNCAVRGAMLAGVLTGTALLHAGPLPDPGKTTLPCYLLPDNAAADGNLSEWQSIPPVPASAFHPTTPPSAEPLAPSDSFAPSLRCGMKRGSTDLYFLVVVKDTRRYVEDRPHWVVGDYCELYLDFGREARDKLFPGWTASDVARKAGPDGHSRWLLPLPMGQFGLRPATLGVAPAVFRTANAAAWKADYACVLVEGGVAYEVRVDTASILADLRQRAQTAAASAPWEVDNKAVLDAIKGLPGYVGMEVAFMDQDYMVELETEGWHNYEGVFRLCGDGMEHSFPDRYGMLATQPVPAPATAAAEPLPFALQTAYGALPTAAQVEKAIGTLPPAKLADLVYWAGVQGAAFNAALVKKLLAVEHPLVQENTLAVLCFTRQDGAARQAALPVMYARDPQAVSPYALTLANLLNAQEADGHRQELLGLLKHADPTVAITAARALAVVGTHADVSVFQDTLSALLADLQTRVNGPYHAEAGRLTACRVFMGAALENLKARTEPITPPMVTPVREIKAANTDLERFIPADGNNVYNGRGLLRSWPKDGPKELWRVQVGQGKSAVIEAGGRAFTAAMADGKQWAVCLDPSNGKTLWKQLLADKESHHVVDGPTVSPVADGDRVYFIPGGNWTDNLAAVVCLNAKDGAEIWRENKVYWGREGTTPLIIGDLLIIGTPQNAQAVVAVNKLTGKLVWGTPPASNEAGSGASSPSYQILDGIPQIIVGVGGHGNGEVWGINATNGLVFWRIPFNTHNGLLSSPVAMGSRIFLTCGGGPNSFSTCLETYVREGAIRVRQVYSDSKRQLNTFNTVAVLDGAVYGFGTGSLQCTRLADGALLWEQKDKDWGADQQLIVADGLIFALTRPGELVLLEANPKEYKELGRTSPGIKFGLPQQPTLANGRLYLRGEQWVVCYKVAGD